MKRPNETYRLIPHKVNSIIFYILEIDSWCHTGVEIVGSKEEAEKIIARDNKYTHLTETHTWVNPKLVKLMVTMLDNSFEYHIASRRDGTIFFNGWSDDLRRIIA